MKWWLLLFFATLAVATYPPPQKSSCQQANINWVRDNADNLLFLEHMKQQASSQNLYDWQTVSKSSDYQTRLEDIRTSTDCSRVVEDFDISETSVSCGSRCDDNRLVIFQAELKRQRLMIQRLYSQIVVLQSTRETSRCEGKSF